MYIADEKLTPIYGQKLLAEIAERGFRPSGDFPSPKRSPSVNPSWICLVRSRNLMPMVISMGYPRPHENNRHKQNQIKYVGR